MFRINRDPDPTPEGGEPIKIDNSLPADKYTPPDLDMTKAIPPEFRDKPYFKDKDFVGLVKDHVNLQTLLGTRPAGIPKEDASDEDWGKFITSIKPKAGDEYAFPETDFSKAGKRTDGLQKTVREMALDIGIPKRQFGKFAEHIEKQLMAAESLGAEQTAATEKEFETLLDTTFKQDKQTVIDRTKKLMLESVTDPVMKEKINAVLPKLSNELLFGLTMILDGVHKKYIAEDAPPGGPVEGSGKSEADLQGEAEKIMSSPEYSDFRRAGHDAAKQKVQEIFSQIAAKRVAGKKS